VSGSVNTTAASPSLGTTAEASRPQGTASPQARGRQQDRGVSLNRTLWVLAEEMRKLKSRGVVATIFSENWSPTSTSAAR